MLERSRGGTPSHIGILFHEFVEIGVSSSSSRRGGISDSLGIKRCPVADAVEGPVAELQRSGQGGGRGDRGTSDVQGSAES